MKTAVDLFRDAMRSAGLGFDGPIETDGRIHRFRAEDDRKPDSWFVLFDGEPAAGAFGCWKRGVRENWCGGRGQKRTDSEWRVIRQRWAEAKATQEMEEAARHKKARTAAERIIARSSSPSATHTYLAAKAVSVCGEIREYRGALVLPLRDAAGELHSLQFIGANGDKRFLTGGRVAGSSFSLAENSEGPLLICEGYATGASLHEATGRATVCAMNAGNLKATAEAQRAKWPDREIIIAADNDAFTPNNPGLRKATEAALAIRAKLVLPHFADDSTRPTDFNDLHRLEGLKTVKEQTEGTATPQETDEAVFKRLALLPPVEYDRVRDAESKRLNLRVGTLDDEVLRRRQKTKQESGQGQSATFSETEPWPHRVDGAEVLSEVAALIRGYVVLPAAAADAVALWIAHTYCFDAFTHTPRLNITAPEKGCGKTTLRDVLAALVSRPIATENVTSAVLFRLVNAHSPTILADEYDAWLPEDETLRGLFNAGHGRDGKVHRCEGDAHEVREFKVFAPAVLSGIGALPGTLVDRSIIISLKRAKPREIVKRFDSRRTDKEKELGRKMARWVADHLEALGECEPVMPDAVFHRVADNWRPLFAIAQLAGGDWPHRVSEAFAILTAQTNSDSLGVPAKLLGDIREVLSEHKDARIFSKDLVRELCAMTDRPWLEENRGKAITEAWLARKLGPFDIHPATRRIGTQRLKGYEVEHFKDAFERYLSEERESKRDTVTTPANTGASPHSESVTASVPVTDGKADDEPANKGLSQCHASTTPTKAMQEEFA